MPRPTAPQRLAEGSARDTRETTRPGPIDAPPEGWHDDALEAANAAGLGLTVGSGSRWWFSPAARDLFGIPQGYAGTPAAQFDPLERLSEYDRSSLRAQLVARSEGEPSKPLQVQLLRLDGGHIPVEATLVDRPGGRVVGWWRDVSERLRSESMIMQNDRMATVGSLAAGLAHEINNPLASVELNLGFLRRSLLRDGVATPRSLDILTKCEQASERVGTIVRDLRSMARHDVEQRMAIDPRQVLDSAITVVSNELKHRARLVREYESVAPVWASEAELGQVFMNLLLNAAHSIDPDRQDGVITARVRSVDDWVTTEIIDNGRGIGEEQLDRIFDPFYTTKSPGKGTGMGLTICANTVATLGGLVSASSDGVGGSLFRVMLPVARARVTVRPRQAESGVHVKRSIRLRILVVDDDVSHADSVVEMLERRHEVSVAYGGDDARERLKQDTYDAVVCDVVMPGTSGITLYREFETTPLRDRFIFMSKADSVPPVAGFLDTTGRPCLRKPIDGNRLGELLQGMIGHHEAAQTGKRATVVDADSQTCPRVTLVGLQSSEGE